MRFAIPCFLLQKKGLIRQASFTLLAFLALGLSFSLASPSLASPAQPQVASPSATSAPFSLADTFARMIERAIPRTYEKRKDWGQTKNITVGIRNKGFKLYRRKKPVNHGTWKHYRLSLVEPEKTLDVQIQDVHAATDGRVGFTLVVKTQFNLWARAKVYRYGVHLIALEIVGDTAVHLEIDGEVGVQLATQQGGAGVALDPRVTDARLDITDFNLDRVSNAKGPLVRELGEELPRWIEHELQGPRLVAKLNRAIDKKRDRLELNFGELFTGK